MAVKTKEQYIESLRQTKPKVYIDGERVENFVDHPKLQNSINTLGAGYDFSNDPKYRDLATLASPLTGEKVSRLWTHLQETQEDSKIKVQLTREFVQRHFCVRCMSNLLCAVWATTYEIDKKHNTEYHHRFIECVKYAQKNDLRLATGMMDAKGDRNLRPSQQTDPDLYLRVVKKSKEGIVVRGAKVQTSHGPCQHGIIVLPSGQLTEKDRDYAVSFYVPNDTEGLTYIVKPGPASQQPREMENPASSHYGAVVALSIFDDVFVPWENVFMCGEWEFTSVAPRVWSAVHRQSKCACTAARHDILLGAAALVAEYNGLEKTRHIREKITDMIMAAEISYGCALGAAVEGHKHPSGVYIPEVCIVNSALYHSRIQYSAELGILHDIAGGLAATIPSEADYYSPDTRELLEKYLKGKANFSTENRIRAFKLIEDLTGSTLSGLLLGSTISAGGSPQTNRVEVLRNFDLERRKNLAKDLAKIT